MQIIIDMSEDEYKRVMDGKWKGNALADYIENGTPLPKGYGNIYDENNIKKEIENPYQCQTVLYGLKLVKPIIEVDKE